MPETLVVVSWYLVQGLALCIVAYMADTIL